MTNSLGLVCQLVLKSGGTWIEGASVDIVFLFEVKLQGVRGFGLVALAALDEFTTNAETIFASGEMASIYKVKATKTHGH